ncbi:hypothetical protein HPB50_007279 [Hyalomma asiaticum]|uniref:Uncharacterized protein n=1 Tax=Hyalomma asiaticum TaxID=266040 RepID=A0ACB7RSX6_HYAAI|nr:hypothetical protein HPB50_007279 [Hyalomma asiaticum]
MSSWREHVDQPLQLPALELSTPQGTLWPFVFLEKITKEKGERLHALSVKAANIAAKAGIALLVAAKFNTWRTTRGCRANTPKGESIVKSLHDYGPTLLMDPHFPTRMGNSVTKPSSPDLTFTNHTGNKTWKNKGEDLGSDHYVLDTYLHASCKGTRTHRIVDWNQFRSNRKDLLYNGNYDDWKEKLLCRH